MAQPSSRTENPREFDHIQEDPSHRLSEEGNSNASDVVKSIFADPEALQLLRSAFINPLNSGASKAPHIKPEVKIIDAGATKAHKTARANDQTVSDEAVSTQTTAKRPSLNAYPEADQQVEAEELDDELASPASRWQASPELTHFIECFRKPLQPFNRKAICRQYPRPDVKAAYTPALDNYLCSLVSGVKQADKDGRFLHLWRSFMNI